MQYKKLLNKFWKITTLMLVVSILVAACGPAATPPPAPTNVPAPTSAPQPTAVPPTAAPQPTAVPPTAAPQPTTATGPAALKVGLVTDVGGPDDKSFNFTAIEGLTRAVKELGISADSKYLQSRQETDYAKNLEEFIGQGYKGIVTVGFLLGGATAGSAKANPGVNYAIVDYAYPDCFGTAVEGKDCGSATEMANVLGLTFRVEQAAFQAGYLAASVSKTKKVGTYGGVNIPPVVDFMVGFQGGVNYWNAKHNDKVELIGWDTKKNDGVFTATFTDPEKGKQAALSLIDEGADVVLPVAGLTGNGTFTAAKEKNTLAIGVDVDQCISVPDACGVILTSVRKNIANAVFEAIKRMSDGSFKGGVYSGTFENDGVSIAPYHDNASKVTAEVQSELDAIKADIIAGKLDIKAWAMGEGKMAPSASAKDLKVGLVTDVGGPDDKSFNFTAIEGLTRAVKELGISADSKYLQSRQETDYAKNLEEFIGQGYKGIVTVGFLLGGATAGSAKANPGVNYAIVDYAYPDCFGTAVEGKDCGSATEMANVLGLTFRVEQAAFQAGYLAASVSKTKKVGTYGGVNIPPVVDFMVGFQGGVNYWNAKHNDKVELIGWDTKKNDGVFTATFTDPEKGKQAALSLIDEGADVVLPVAGLTGNGTFTAAKEKNTLAIGVDVDQCISVPDACGVILTSVRKNIANAVFEAIKRMSDGSFKGGVYSGTFENDGVSIAPYHDNASKVTAEVQSELDAIKADIIAGKLDIKAWAMGEGK